MTTKRSLMALFVAGLLITPACGGDDDAPAGGEAFGESPAAGSDGDTEATGDGDDGDAPAGSALTGCDLLGAEEVEAVVGNPITGFASFGAGCSYDVGDIADVNASFTTIDVGSGDATLICDSALTAFTDYEEISGLGDAAYAESNTATIDFEPGKRLANAGVLACTGNLVVSLGLNGHRGEDELRQMAVELVGLILQRA